MNKRSFTITNNIINKSSGNFLKLAQQQGINDAVAQNDAAKIKDAATKRFNIWSENRNFRTAMPVVGNLFNVLDPVQKMALLDYYIKEIESGKNKGDNVNAAFTGSDLLGATSSTNNFNVQRATALKILKGEFTKQNQSFQSGATPPATAAEDAGAGGAASTGAASTGAAAAGAASTGAGAAAAPEIANFGFGQQDKLSPPATSPGSITSPEVKTDPTAPAAAPAAAAGATGGAAAAVSTAPATAENALPAATPPAPTGSKPPPPKYFFPGGKTGGIEGFHGPYISPEGKNRYFKTKYDAASRAYLFTGEFEDK